ncbi:MAG: DUF3277 family protein [Alphaproteobacteria bacterium]|nr:DUF3277 family protein [Alphaproteobacteria bacterium]
MTNPYVPEFSTYSFMDVTAVLYGPGVNGLTIGGPHSASAEEGVTVTLSEETNTQTIGADGSVMNSLHASRAGTATFRLLKTSPVNQGLMRVYNYQRTQSNIWGLNTIVIRDVAREDLYTCQGCAFVRFPTNAYAKLGNTLEWEFHVSVVDASLGWGINFEFSEGTFQGPAGGVTV